MPLTELAEIEQRQKETSDALARLLQKGSASFSGIPDVRASIKRLEVDATLGAGELLKISSLLTAALRLKNYGNKEKEKSVSHQPEWKQELEPEEADVILQLSYINNTYYFTYLLFLRSCTKYISTL